MANGEAMSRKIAAGAIALALMAAGGAGAQERVGVRGTWGEPANAPSAFHNMEELFPSRRIAPPATALPLKEPTGPLAFTYTYKGKTKTLEDFAADTRTSGLLILRGDQILHERYYMGASPDSRFISFSVGKSFVSTLIGIALAEGKIRSLDDRMIDYLPDLKGGAYEKTTIKDVLEMSSGTEFDEEYTSAKSGIAGFLGRFDANQGGLYDYSRQFKSAHAPGAKFNYASADTEVLGMLVRRAVGEPLADYLSRKVWAPMGAEADARWMLDAPGAAGQEVAAGGVLARLRDYGRFGLLFARGGELDGRRIVPADWSVEAVRPHRPNLAPGKLGGRSQLGYGYQWWLAPDRPGREGLFMAIGIHGQYILVDRKRDLVVVKTAAWPTASNPALAEETFAFFDGVIDAVDREAAR